MATHPVTVYVVALAILAWLLSRLVFVARVWESFVRTPIGELGTFTHHLIIQADALTLVVCAVGLLLTVGLLRAIKRTAVLPAQQLV